MTLAARGMDLLLAAVLVGIVSLAYSVVVGPGLEWHMLAVVPLTVMWGFLLGAGTAGSPLMVTFPLATIAVLGLAWLALRYIDTRPVRVVLIGLLFGGQIVGFAYLLFLFGLVAE